MEDISKRLVEVEYILKKLDDEYIRKIPKEIWNYFEENKDKSYIYNYDESKTLDQQNLSIDTISILTYINMEYLLDEKDKKEMQELLRKDYIIAEEKKKEKYNPEDIFKNNSISNSCKEENKLLPIEAKIEKWYERLFSFVKSIFKRWRLLDKSENFWF